MAGLVSYACKQASKQAIDDDKCYGCRCVDFQMLQLSGDRRPLLPGSHCIMAYNRFGVFSAFFVGHKANQGPRQRRLNKYMIGLWPFRGPPRLSLGSSNSIIASFMHNPLAGITYNGPFFAEKWSLRAMPRRCSLEESLC